MSVAKAREARTRKRDVRLATERRDLTAQCLLSAAMCFAEDSSRIQRLRYTAREFADAHRILVAISGVKP